MANYFPKMMAKSAGYLQAATAAPAPPPPPKEDRPLVDY